MDERFLTVIAARSSECGLAETNTPTTQQLIFWPMTISRPKKRLTRNAELDENHRALTGLEAIRRMIELTDYELKRLLKACVNGDADSRIKFQNLFGESIYNYPLKIFHLPNDKAGDFYIYAFDEDRIFRRVAGFEARNGAQFRTYLNYYVLRDLFLEWQRTLKDPETISLATALSDDSGKSGRTLEDILADPTPNAIDSLESAANAIEVKAFMEKLDPEKALLLKLVHLADFDLFPQEIRFLCKKSGRSYKEIIFDIEETRNRLVKKDERLYALQSTLDSIYGQILFYQKESRKLAEKLDSLPEQSTHYRDAKSERDELDRKLEWRYRQRTQTLEKIRQVSVTTPYKDIARLLNAPLGTVCSLVARTRGEVIGAIGEVEVLKAAAGL